MNTKFKTFHEELKALCDKHNVYIAANGDTIMVYDAIHLEQAEIDFLLDAIEDKTNLATFASTVNSLTSGNT